MELVTTTGFAPGDDRGARADGATGTVTRDQIVLLPRLGLLAVADAPSGADDGRAGARLALELVRGHVERNEDVIQRFRRNPTPDLRHQVLSLIEDAFSRAAQELFAFARRRTEVLVTLDVLLLLETEAFIGHVGDGRVYLVRRGLVHQLTVDHSRGDDVIQFGEPSTEERDSASATPASTPGPTAGDGLGDRRFTRALGPQPRVRVESLCMELALEDRFVVCAASLHRAIPEGILHTRMISEHLERLGPVLVSDARGAAVLAASAQLGSGEPFTADSAQARLAILAPMPLFHHCTERELRSVAQATHPRRLPAETVVFEEGQPGTELYIVISGRVEVLKGGAAIATLGPGSNFGEMAMLDDPVRSATARTIEDTELMVISRQAFFALLRGNPPLAVKMLWNLLLRLSANLRQTSSRLAELEPVRTPGPAPSPE